MDKRKLKFRGGLHKNLIGSQTSLNSGSSFETKSHNAEPSTSKITLLSNKTFSSQSQNKSSNEEIFTNNSKSSQGETSIRKSKTSNVVSSRKRKSLSFSESKDEDDDDLGAPLAESTVLKKRRDNSTVTQIECENINSKNISTTLQNISTTLNTQCEFVKFLHESGIKLNPVAPHILSKDIIIVRQKMKELLNSKKYEKAKLMELMKDYFDDEQNLENALNDMEIFVNSEVSHVLHSSSLIKILLQVSELHPEIYSSLLTKLNEAILVADSIETVPWAISLLQQFRFLDVVTNSDALTNSLEQLLESCPTWFQRELILVLPDIVTDKQHQAVAEILDKVLEDNSEITSLILDCMSNLNLGKEYLDEYKNKILNLLKTNIKVNAIPAVVKFILEDCTNMDIFKKTLTVLRNIDMQPLAGENVAECYQNQLDIVDTLKMNMLLSKSIINTAITVIKDIVKDPKPLDIILLLLIFSTTEIRRKNVETIFKQHIRSGFYRASLLNSLYNDYKQVVQELQPAALQLSSNLLKSDERVFIDFAIDWLRLQFICHKKNMFNQREILERIIFLMGDNDQTVKNALTFLCKMVTKEEERQCLAPHCNHLRILLEKMDNLGLQDVGTVNDLLQNLCINSSSVSDSLRDDLFILLQKQLSNFKPLYVLIKYEEIILNKHFFYFKLNYFRTKCKGVLAAVMAIKHLMKKDETSKAAYNLFNTVLNNVKNCPRSQALFYDQLTLIISETQDIDTEFIKNLSNFIEEEFVNTYMIDKSSYRGELVPKFGLNKAEDEPQNCVLTFENKKFGAIVPISFKLLRTCCIKLSKNGDLDAIDSLLGCGILMPENFDVAENSTMDLVICCINWFREIISGFVMQKDSLLQKQVLQRLDNLIYLQTELSTLFSLCDTKYQPSPCYFHHFPLPHFVKIEKKVGRKGKKGKKVSPEKSTSFSETRSWELGSLICSKNPTYFRRLDATIVHLLDIKLKLNTSQSKQHNVSVKQVCFIVKELLTIFELENNENFVRDLIELLPIICSKLQDIVDTLREERNNQNNEAARLLLCLLTKIFNWKGFESVTYNLLLREGLRTVASQINKNNVTLRSCKELVGESCKYFESLADIATQISLAITLINTCQSIMKHSESYTRENKEKYAKMAFGFLCLEWPDDKEFTSQYKAAVIGLLNSWIDNETLPLQTVTTILEWLPDETPKLVKPQDCLNRIPSIKRNNFHFLFKKIFDGLVNGVKIALPLANRDPERIEIWSEVAANVQKLVQISKALTTKNNVLIFMKHMPILLKYFLNLGMPVLEHNLKYQMDDVTRILKMMQGGTRYLHTICCDSSEKKDITLSKYIPAAKSVLERLLYSVKGMLVLNNSPAAFWMGNLVNKNLEGQEILSQSVSSEGNTLPSSDVIDNLTNVSSDILDSDSDDDLPGDDDI
ncbi:Fanconi anemia group D2 protein homolog isoform X1 [Hylaeus anthracinus]|uniref:Fanconi anemia group D2 protein homolog isoform X1 n=1 Tax=Hylaeus anthracinus TaxID=313031 RepID=UPI0023B9DC30|nr:Fanconi anemia group D2 protein homolog isoform X1 [Hylaeus anthracinus]